MLVRLPRRRLMVVIVMVSCSVPNLSRALSFVRELQVLCCMADMAA